MNVQIANDVLGAIERWRCPIRGSVAPLIEAFPLDYSEASRLALLVQLRLGADVAAAATIRWSEPEATSLTVFVSRSMRLRRSVALRRASKLQELCGESLVPSKYALSLLHALTFVRRRYFRDIDFRTPPSAFPELWGNLGKLGYIAGDIDAKNWNFFIATIQETLLEQAAEVPEVHFFALDLANDELLERLWDTIEQRWPRLVETQFYGRHKQDFLLRTFLDIEFSSSIGERPFDAPTLYIDSFVDAVLSDIKRGRLGVNQYIELLDYIDTMNDSRTAFSTISGSVSRIWTHLGCSSQQLRIAAREATIPFVQEKLDWLQGCARK